MLSGFEGAPLLGQGITGAEGRTALPWMLEYGTKIVAGVTPGKGGQSLHGVPIFDSVKDAARAVGPFYGSVLYVPPLAVLPAATEALLAGVKFILIGAEKVPTRDAAAIAALARERAACVIGPSSVGLINPRRRLKIGSIGGGEPGRVFVSGEVAVVSKSGGMTSEIALHLKNNGLGVSYAVGLGGDRLSCTDFGDFLLMLEEDEPTRVTVIFGELGGTYEERLAKLVKVGKIKKPVVAFIAGEFTARLPSEVQFGHAGAIIEGGRGLPEEKRRILKEAGLRVADSLDDIASLVRESLS